MPRAIDIVRKVAPRARGNYSLAFERGDALLKAHDITTPKRLAHFLAQVLHETDGLTIEWESGNYSAPRLLEIFGVGHHSAGITPNEASELAHQPMPKREELIFERVYGLGNPRKSEELGNVKAGDGYRYRGGGILQTTGRANYRRMGNKCGVDLEGNPQLVVSEQHALKPALSEWSEGDLNAVADRDDIVKITRRINGGLNGLDSRRDWLAKVRPLITSVEFAEGLEAPEPRPVSPESIPRVVRPDPSLSGPMPSAGASDLAHRIIAAMERKGYQIDRGPGELNIVYVEGMNPDGTPNDDEANKWNDLRLLIKFEGGEPKIVGSWAATSEPGRYFTQNPLSPLGAARIEFGQYKAWQVGMHRGNHEALVQTGGKVTVCRDLNKDGLRTGDTRETGEFGINQHWGYDLPEVEKASAGCLVGQSKNGHREFMAIVKSDPRYLANRKLVFATAILPEADVLAEGPAAGPPQVEQPQVDVPLVPSDESDNVRRLQKLLGFSEEEQDGIFGAITEEGVKRFQRRHGLTVTGDMDAKAWDLLEREAATPLEGGPIVEKPVGGVKPPEPVKPIQPEARPVIPDVLPTVVPKVIPKVIPKLLLGVGTMNPLIAIAAGVLPEILKAVVGDKAGTVAGAVQKAVTEVTRTENPEQAQQKLEADPAAVAALQLKLAEIAAEQEEKRQQAQLALLKEQNEQEAKRQQAQLALLREQSEQEAKKREAEVQALGKRLEDTKDARANLRALSGERPGIALTAPILSYVVTGGFFIVLLLLLYFGPPKRDDVTLQVINIVIGALVAAFATVVNFWLGSSQGSRLKEERQAQSIDLIAQQNAAAAQDRAAKQNETLQAIKMATGPAAAAPKPSNFHRCFDIVLGYERGFSEKPGDPRGSTQDGVTLGDLKEFRQDQTLTLEDLKKLSRDDACEVYRTRYWNVLRCDDLPIGVDLVVFDFAVDTNTALSAKTLQQVVGAGADGSIGDATLAATKAKPARNVVKEMTPRRHEYYQTLQNAANFIRDARERTDAVEKKALDMMSAPPSAP